MKEFIKKYFPKFSLVFLPLFIITLLLWWVAASIPSVADLIVSGIGYVLRRLLSFITGFTYISLMEILFLTIIVFAIISIIKIFKSKKGYHEIIRKMVGIVSLFAFAVTIYVYTLGVGYHATPISSKLELERRQNIDEASLKNTLIILKEKTESLLDEIEFAEGGESVCPMTVAQISKKLCRAYDVLETEYRGLNLKNFDSIAKEAVASDALLSLQITGVFSFYTAEATVSTSYPDYVRPFTVAHEMAHQRGISRENEANFVAFLSCIRTDDPYIQYAGYLNMFEYVASSLNKADSVARKDVYSTLDERILGEMRAYSEFYYANRNELLEKISHFFNDNYLKLQGTEGIISYGLVTELCVQYYDQ